MTTCNPGNKGWLAGWLYPITLIVITDPENHFIHFTIKSGPLSCTGRQEIQVLIEKTLRDTQDAGDYHNCSTHRAPKWSVK